MSKTRIAVIVLPAEYEAFIRLIPEDSFPKSYDAWSRRTSGEKARCIARGDKLTEIDVHPEEFEDYCQSAGLQPSYAMLEAFAVKKAHGRPQNGRIG